MDNFLLNVLAGLVANLIASVKNNIVVSIIILTAILLVYKKVKNHPTHNGSKSGSGWEFDVKIKFLKK